MRLRSLAQTGKAETENVWLDQLSVIESVKNDNKKRGQTPHFPHRRPFDEGCPVTLNLAKRLRRDGVAKAEDVRLAEDGPRAEPGRRNQRWGLRSEKRLPWRVALAWWVVLSVVGWILIFAALHLAGVL